MAKKNTYTCLQTVKWDGKLHAPGAEIELTEADFEAIVDRNANALAIGGVSEEVDEVPSPSKMTVEQLEARADELDIDRSAIEGTGSNGQVVKKDLVAVVEAAEAE